MYNRLLRYREKCVVLKRIQSNKSRFFRNLNNIQNFLTIFVSAFITFIGFSGIEKIKDYVNMVFGTSINVQFVEMMYNILVFLMFFIGVSHLVFQFTKKQTESDSAITLLSNLINEIDNCLSSPNINSIYANALFDKYEMIAQSIPSNSDREYKKAKKSIKNGKPMVNSYLLYEKALPLNETEQESIIKDIIQKDPLLQNVLDTLSKYDETLYLGGGVIRNRVWDLLHGYDNYTQIEDFDIIYYDKTDASKEHDLRLEEKLKKQQPNLDWSVKNQARMHIINNDEEYISLDDALSKWPETASAILVRKDDVDSYEIKAPFGCDDLFKLIVCPTPHFLENKINEYKKRVNEKKWQEKWDRLKVLYLD